MPQWLAIVLPALPLQRAARALAVPRPLAIVEGPAQRRYVVQANAVAAALGVRSGQRLAAAQALAGDLLAVVRDATAERAELHALANWAYQFSAQIAWPPPAEPGCALPADAGLLIETGASERLFAGQAALHRRIAHGLQALGYTAQLAAAATPRAAWLLALARVADLTTATAPPADPAAHPAPATRLTAAPATITAPPTATTPSATLPPTPAALLPNDGGTALAALRTLPLTLLRWDAAVTDTLHTLGLRTLGDLLALPRDAFARRFGTARLMALDRLLGRLPDPQPAFVPPPHFAAGLDLPADLTESAQLMFPAHRLLRQLEGFLRGHGAGATTLVFNVRHPARRARPCAPTLFELRLAAPERDAGRLARLLAERLTRVVLPAPAVGLHLAVTQLLPFAAIEATLLPPAPSGARGTGWLQLVETLHARLGSERVYQWQPADDHRPEHAQRRLPPALSPDERTGVTAGPGVPRPLLLLPQPQPLAATDEQPQCGGPLQLLAGPERIESGWWDQAGPDRGAVLRDYFVARNPHGQTLWVYRERNAPRGWYLHGWFA